MSENHQPENASGYRQVQPEELDHHTSPSPDPHKTAQPEPFTRYPIISGDEWAFEIFLSLISTGIFAVIVAIFLLMHDRPLSQWPLPVTPNSTVSFLTTACSAALMHNVSSCIGQLKWLHFKQSSHQLYNLERFDEASRGPYGSVTFLVRVKWNLASLGAVITICRLAFSPLAQEVINLKPRDVTMPVGAGAPLRAIPTFGYVQRYGRNIDNAGVLLAAAVSEEQDPLMQSAILQGIYNISTPPTFSCSGACQWQGSYVSLGFKTTCQDVTAATLRTRNCMTRPVGNQGFEFSFCNVTTPQGISLSARQEGMVGNKTAITTRTRPIFNATTYGTTFRLNSTSPTKGARVEFFSLSDAIIQQLPTVLRFAVYRATSPFPKPLTNENVTECSLSFTAYEYQGASSNGSEFRFHNVREIDLPQQGWHFLERLRMKLRFSADRLNPPRHGFPELDTSLPEIISLQTYFRSSMISSEWVSGEGYQNVDYGISAALMGDVDLEARFQNMAVSMTDYMRSSTNQIHAQGMRIESVVFVTVRWEWLIGPAVTQLATLVFIVFTMTSNRRSRDVPLWKSSSLAVLSCFHDVASGSLRGGIRDVKEIQKRAKESFVRLD
ncbi:hypothetical protein CP533_2444 [Ophiocordyceps camponoti-saundersi (nom. inval.)]|nr:hypothetical protein CP533_2444 [Ophiocordyceps camponoti-saundersi (nom. inval.)]